MLFIVRSVFVPIFLMLGSLVLSHMNFVREDVMTWPIYSNKWTSVSAFQY